VAKSKYDIVAYPGYPFEQTHPDRMATVGRLLGLKPPDVRKCRVLELACGDGGNLIPMALTLPRARFFGVDLAKQPVAQGQKVIKALGLPNIRLAQGDLLDPQCIEGEFDYIITHGLYAWSPPAVRDAILRISSQHLAPNGIAYVSYNALPGGRLRQMLREMMLFHAGDFADPIEKAEQARALLTLIAQGRTREDPFNTLVRDEVARMSDRDLWYLFHDELADVYEPVYLHQFAGHAGHYGLQYLGDANLYNLQPAMLTPEAQQTIDSLAGEDRLLREQYVDFIQCRRFHHSLLCKQEVTVLFPPAAERIAGLWASSPAVMVADGEFKGPLDSGMRTQHPVALRMMKALIAAWPCSLRFKKPEELQILLATSLAGLTELRTAPLPVANKVSERPVASPLARYQAARGGPLTTLTHSTVEADAEFELKVLPLLDGTRDVASLARRLRVPSQRVEISLLKLARLGFLLG
jgi:SAM-dependent methyltransferase